MEDRPFHTARLRQRLPGRIGQSAELYLDALGVEGKAAGTRYEYHRELEILGSEHPELAPEEFTPFLLQAYIADRCQGVGRKGVAARPLSQNTRRKLPAILGGYFGWLYANGAIPTNPMRGIKRPTAPEPEPTFWTPDEVRRILSVPMSARDRLVLELFARTGQRMTPIRMLTWDRVHIDSPPFRISFPQAKGGKFHTLPIEDRALLAALRTYRHLVNPTPTDWVLMSNQRKPLSEQQINRIIERACLEAGVRRGTAHEFRKSCITNALMRGEKLEVVSRGIANHSNPATTIRHYRQIPEVEVAKALKGLY